VSWLSQNVGEVLQYGLAHLLLSLPPIVIGFVISIPIGWFANRYRLSRGILLSIGAILYAVPSLALFVVLPLLLGTQILNPINVVAALSIYALALMVRTTTDALASVSGDVKQSATAMGYSAWGRFFAVELPLAGPVLLAGLRVISVSTVSLVSVGSVVGVQSLGFLFLDGYQRDIPEEIVVGILGTVVIAVFLDVLIVLIGRALMPWTRGQRRTRRRAARQAGLVGAS
jgi:osmoprotectant transport system permease protein